MGRANGLKVTVAAMIAGLGRKLPCPDARSGLLNLLLYLLKVLGAARGPEALLRSQVEKYQFCRFQAQNVAARFRINGQLQTAVSLFLRLWTSGFVFDEFYPLPLPTVDLVHPAYQPSACPVKLEVLFLMQKLQPSSGPYPPDPLQLAHAPFPIFPLLERVSKTGSVPMPVKQSLDTFLGTVFRTTG